MQENRTLTQLLAEATELQTRIAALRPFAKEESFQNSLKVRINLSQSCNTLEGGCMAEADVRTVLVDKMAVGGISLREHLEVTGYARGVEHILELSRPPLGNGPTAPERTIKRLHKLCLGSVSEHGAGSYRKRRVVSVAADCPRPQDIPLLMTEFTAQQVEQNKRLHPVLYAAWLHHRFYEISPFSDGNGVVARLLLNLALLRRKHVATPIPGKYAAEYLAALKASSEEPLAFQILLSVCHVEAQKNHLELFEK